MPSRNPGCLPIRGKQKSVLVWIKVWVKARVSLWIVRSALAFHIKLLQTTNEFQTATLFPQSHTVLQSTVPSFSPSAHASSPCIMTAVVKVVSCVDANANPRRQTISTYCPLYRRRTKNIISWHKQRCHCVHHGEPCLNIQCLPRTWGSSFDVYGRDFMS